MQCGTNEAERAEKAENTKEDFVATGKAYEIVSSDQLIPPAD